MILAVFLLSWISFSTSLSFVYGGWFIVLWIILGLLVGLLMAVFTVLFHMLFIHKLSLTSKYKHFFFKSVAYFVSRILLNTKIKVINQNLIPKDGKLVIYGNHKSYVDPVVVMQLANRTTAFTPKASLYKFFVFNYYFKAMGAMKVSRGNDRETAKSLVEAIKNVKNGLVMTVFPEGGIINRDNEQISSTRAGAFKMAVKSEATILPITLNGLSKMKTKPFFWPKKVVVVVHDPILFSQYNGLTTTEIAEIVMKKINDGLIKEW